MGIAARGGDAVNDRCKSEPQTDLHRGQLRALANAAAGCVCGVEFTPIPGRPENDGGG